MKIVMREGGEQRVLRFKFLGQKKDPMSTQKPKIISIHKDDKFGQIERKIGLKLAPLILEIWRIIPSLESLKVRPNQIILNLEIGKGWPPEDEALARGAIERRFYQESIEWFVHRWGENQKPL